MVRNIWNHYGRIDVLVNVAGGFSMGPPVHETPLTTWEFMLNLNARTVFLTSREILPIMIDQGKGKIVSIAARAALAGKAHMAPYVVSKSAVLRLTESMAAELQEYDINVNCVLPGTIDTPRNRAQNPAADFSKWVAPEALADVILFLASDGARAISGAAIPVYGRN
jgi:NAD(P)-dependent dehydrogenase (short-subunit alcohol dehydrogenase family)